MKSFVSRIIGRLSKLVHWIRQFVNDKPMLKWVLQIIVQKLIEQVIAILF